MTDQEQVPTVAVPVPLLQQMVDILQELPHRQVNGTLQTLQNWQAAQRQAEQAKGPLGAVKRPDPGAGTQESDPAPSDDADTTH